MTEKQTHLKSGIHIKTPLNAAALPRVLIFAVMFAAMVLVMAGCGAGSGAEVEPVQGDGFYLDTICTVSVYRMADNQGNVKPAAEMEDEASAAIDESLELCKELENKLSRTKKNSDISRVNAAGGEWVDVSDEACELIQKGLEFSQLSDGGFDITCGGITEQWDFHAAEGEEKLPDGKSLSEAVKHIDYHNVEIEDGRVRLSDPDTKLELGGIAKGYIGDKMAEVLEARGVVSAVVNLGGNVICIGGKSDEEGFMIGVETPFSDRSEIIGKIEAADKTLVTSGVYERRIEVDGKTYHHILDTKTGWPVETDLDAVTLIAKKGRSGDMDALSTICLIKGSKDAKELIDSMEGVEGVFVLSDGSVITTEDAGFEKID